MREIVASAASSRKLVFTASFRGTLEKRSRKRYHGKQRRPGRGNDISPGEKSNGIRPGRIYISICWGIEKVASSERKIDDAIASIDTRIFLYIFSRVPSWQTEFVSKRSFYSSFKRTVKNNHRVCAFDQFFRLTSTLSELRHTRLITLRRLIGAQRSSSDGIDPWKSKRHLAPRTEPNYSSGQFETRDHELSRGN